uniref:Uncharacterized protein n=1 Tax=Oryza nivara TaxID=4536 RepID=A0A0E0J9T3_ORYNI
MLRPWAANHPHERQSRHLLVHVAAALRRQQRSHADRFLTREQLTGVVERFDMAKASTSPLSSPFTASSLDLDGTGFGGEDDRKLGGNAVVQILESFSGTHKQQPTGNRQPSQPTTPIPPSPRPPCISAGGRRHRPQPPRPFAAAATASPLRRRCLTHSPPPPPHPFATATASPLRHSRCLFVGVVASALFIGVVASALFVGVVASALFAGVVTSANSRRLFAGVVASPYHRHCRSAASSSRCRPVSRSVNL